MAVIKIPDGKGGWIKLPTVKGEPGKDGNDGTEVTKEDVERALGHTVKKDVPMDAKFTDTTYTAGDNIAIVDEKISVTGQLGLTEEEVKGVRVDNAKDADTVRGQDVVYELGEVAEDLSKLHDKVWEEHPTPVYGFEIDENNTNPKTAVKYIGDAVGMTPASGNNGNFNWGSWESFVKEISRPVVVKNGVEQYDLNYDNYNQKASGGASNLTGSDGDIFTRFEHVHMKHTKISNGHRWELSTEPFLGSFSMTKEMENGYNQFSNPMLVPLQNLFILIFKNRDSQTALGRGRVDGTGHLSSGNTNNKGFMFGSTQDEQIKFLGIEDFWGNKRQWIDGLITDGSCNLLLGDKNFNDSGSGYSKQNTNISSAINGYINRTQGGKGGYIISDGSGSATTGYADYGYLSSRQVGYLGGSRSGRDYAGAFQLDLGYYVSDSYAWVSARLCYKNNDAFYVGAYLGYEQSGKLRSISGNLSQGGKTIGAYRVLAQANN